MDEKQNILIITDRICILNKDKINNYDILNWKNITKKNFCEYKIIFLDLPFSNNLNINNFTFLLDEIDYFLKHKDNNLILFLGSNISKDSDYDKKILELNKVGNETFLKIKNDFDFYNDNRFLRIQAIKKYIECSKSKKNINNFDNARIDKSDELDEFDKKQASALADIKIDFSTKVNVKNKAIKFDEKQTLTLVDLFHNFANKLDEYIYYSTPKDIFIEFCILSSLKICSKVHVTKENNITSKYFRKYLSDNLLSWWIINKHDITSDNKVNINLREEFSTLSDKGEDIISGIIKYNNSYIMFFPPIINNFEDIIIKINKYIKNHVLKGNLKKVKVKNQKKEEELYEITTIRGEEKKKETSYKNFDDKQEYLKNNKFTLLLDIPDHRYEFKNKEVKFNSLKIKFLKFIFLDCRGSVITKEIMSTYKEDIGKKIEAGTVDVILGIIRDIINHNKEQDTEIRFESVPTESYKVVLEKNASICIIDYYKDNSLN